MTSDKIIAVVDDDPIFQIIAKKMMSICAPEWRVVGFGSGNDTLQFLKANCLSADQIPDIMLLDINMPQFDGWMFMEEFRKIKETLSKSIKIYLTSSSIDPKDISRAKLDPDLVDYIIKPLTEDISKKITAE
jgi:CheY-like chemotaxis protein